MRSQINDNRRPIVGLVLCVAAVAVVLALSGFSSATGGRPRPVSRLPLTIPRGGVDLDHQVVFLPATPVKHGISKAEAMRLGDQGIHSGFARRVFEADVREKFAPWVGRYPAWVVVFTSPRPISVGQGPAGAPPFYATQNISVFNRRTGRFTVGLYGK